MRGPSCEPTTGGSEALGRLGAQQSLDGGVDVPTGGNECLKVGLAVDEPHGVELLQLRLELHLRALGVPGEGGREQR